MIRGTTPTITLELGIDPSSFEACFVTFKQHGKLVLEKPLEKLRLGETSVSFTMTQEETLAFDTSAYCVVQVRARDAAGNALASNIMRVDVEQVIKDGVI